MVGVETKQQVNCHHLLYFKDNHYSHKESHTSLYTAGRKEKLFHKGGK